MTPVWPVVPGVPATGHVTSGGWWHPGSGDSCSKCGTDRITCPVCHRTSYNRNDVRAGYCGYCHDWTSPRP
jgi:hypothetical protein